MSKIKKISRMHDDSRPDLGTGIEITFVDQEKTEVTYFLSSETLRRSCPCASCLQKSGDTSHDKPLSGNKPASGSSLLNVISSSAEEECNLQKIWALGNYAIGMKWADGHDSGIYTYSLLEALARGKESA